MDHVARCRALGLTDRLELAPVAVRALGDDLLVARPGPWRPPQRLTGTGPMLWHLLGEGWSLGETAQRVAQTLGAPLEEVEHGVVAFAADLVAADLARRA